MWILTFPIPSGLYKTKQSEKKPIWNKCQNPCVEEPVAGTAFEVVLGLKGVCSPVGGCGYQDRADHRTPPKTEQSAVDVIGDGQPLRVFQRKVPGIQSSIQITAKTCLSWEHLCPGLQHSLYPLLLRTPLGD